MGHQENEYPKSVHAKLDLILENLNKGEEKYLPLKPYKKILQPFRYMYEHPGASIGIAIIVGEGIMDLFKKGLLTFVVKLFLGQ